MNPKYLVKDIYLSIRALSLGALIRSRPVITADPDAIHSILVIRIDRIGDVVISLPAVKALKAIFPNAKISVLVQPSIAALIANEPYISEVIPFTGFSRVIRLIRNMKFDIAVDLLMDYSIKTALIAYFSKAVVKAGFDIAGRGRFFNIAVKPDQKEKHMSEHALDIVRAIGRSYRAEYRADRNAEPHLTVSADAIAVAGDILYRNGINKGQRIVSIHPGGYFPSQRWMPEAFAELADRVADKHNVKIIIIGSSSEEKLIEGIISRTITKPVYMAGRSLDVIAAIIKASELLICNNSGPLHIAAAVGTSTVSTLGPTVSYLWRPLGGSHAVIHHAVSCSPCNEGSCEDHECMKRISVDEMEDAVSRILDKHSLLKEGCPGAKTPKYEFGKILVINLGGIGDAMLSTPALRALKNNYPGAKLYFLGVKRVGEFVKNLSYIDEILIFTLGVSPAAIVNNINTLAYLRRQKIDIAINMRTLVSRRGAMKIRMLMGSIAPRLTVGRDTDGMGSYFDIRIPESLAGDKSELEYDLDAVRALGCDILTKEPDIIIDDYSMKKSGAMLSAYGITGSDILIGIHPGGKPSHRWPAEKFSGAMDSISDRINAKFIITGDEEDRSAAKVIIGSSKAEIVDVTGKLSLGELGAVIKRCSLFICNDTAAMHIAAVLKVPLVAIFGPGYLRRFDPRNISKDAVAIHKETGCAPCDLKICDKMECLKAVAADEVVDAAMKFLAKGKRVDAAGIKG